MKPEKIEELIVKWVDHCLTKEEAQELEKAVEQDDSLRIHLDELAQLKVVMKAEIPSSVEPPYPDFFNSYLMRKVELEVSAQKPKERVKRWWQGLRWAWAPTAALSLVLSFLAGKRMANPQLPLRFKVDEVLPSVYFSDERLTAEVISDIDGGVSAIVVTGLHKLESRGSFTGIEKAKASERELPVSYQRFESDRFH